MNHCLNILSPEKRRMESTGRSLADLLQKFTLFNRKNSLRPQQGMDLICIKEFNDASSRGSRLVKRWERR